MTTQLLIEALDLSEARLDTENRVIRDAVLIRAGMSANRRLYPPKVLETAVTVFEGAKAYANHPGKSELKERAERSIRDLTGWYANVRYENGALVADRYFTRTQAGQDAFAIAQDVVEGRAPKSLAGLSINAVGKGKAIDHETGKAVEVEAITHALSVDDVTIPAAGGAYTEAANGDELLTALLESLSYEEWFEAKPEYTKRLQNEMKKVRQDEALKAAQAEAERLQLALDEAQTAREALTAECEAVRSDLQRARRELAVIEALGKVNLPATWQTDLRKRLMEAAPEDWHTIIDTEKKKAARANAVPKVPVTGAGQQTLPAAAVTMQESIVPRDDEDAVTWYARISKHGA